MILVGKGTVITRDDTNPLIKDGGVVLEGERIVKVGDYETLRSEYPQAELIDAKGQIIMPSLIICTNIFTVHLPEDYLLMDTTQTDF